MVSYSLLFSNDFNCHTQVLSQVDVLDYGKCHHDLFWIKSKTIDTGVLSTLPLHDFYIVDKKKKPNIQERGLLMLDMDATSINIECIDELAKIYGVEKKVEAITEQAMVGNMDFSESLINRVAHLRGLEKSSMYRLFDVLEVNNGFKSLIDAFKACQWKIVLATGGFDFVAQHLMTTYHLDGFIANVLECKHDRLTGRVIGDIISPEHKAEYLQYLLKEWNIPVTQSIAIGDGANDINMLSSAQLSVGFRNKFILNDIVDLKLSYTGLDVAFYVLRYL